MHTVSVSCIARVCYFTEFFSEQVQFVYISPKVLPSPFNCSGSTSLSPTLSLRCVHWREFSLTTPTNICTPFSGAQKPVCWIMRPLLTFVTVLVVARASQLVGELIVIGITWWYTYQSYRIRKISNSSSRTVNSVLVSNGESLYGLSRSLLIFGD